MANRAYQYETSPRKYEQEYDNRPKKRKKQKNKSVQKAQNVKNAQKEKQEKKKQRIEAFKFRVTVTFNVLIFLTIMFAVIYRNALITQSFSEIQGLKSKVSEIQKENDQLEISIQNSLNLSTIEQTAKDLLGMQKLTNKQTIYLTLPKKDYVEPSAEEVVIEENTGIIQSIINFITNIF